MKNCVWRVWGILFFVLVTTGWFPKDSEGLPLFARKYGVQCTTCHVQFPKLNDFGIAFKNRGYRMHGEEGDFLWNSKIFPIAAIARVGYVYTNKDTAGTPTRTSQGVDSGVEIFSAGTLAPRISYFVDALTADNAPLVQFDDILPDSALNIKVGDFNVDNYYLSNPRRLTESTYLIQTTGAGMASGSAASGSGARSDNATFTNLGVELNGQFVDQGFRYIIGAGNDNSTGSQDKFGQMYYVILNQEIMRQHTLSFLFRGDRIGASADNLTPAAALASLQYHPVPNVKLNLEYVDFNSNAGGK